MSKVKESIKHILVVGAGNVASHLIHSFHQAGVKIDLFSRTANKALDLAKQTGGTIYSNWSDVPNHFNLVLLAINDDQLKETIHKIPHHFDLAYTSGGLDLNEFDHENIGVFYPLQTFTKGQQLDLKSAPFFVEAKNNRLEKTLVELAKTISNNVQLANSDTRLKLHIAGVLVNNFTNHLYKLTADFLNENNIDWKLVLPLIEETTQKIKLMNPEDAQTGPARRGDFETISRHKEALTDELRQVYNILTDSIISTHNIKKDGI